MLHTEIAREVLVIEFIGPDIRCAHASASSARIIQVMEGKITRLAVSEIAWLIFSFFIRLAVFTVMAT
jgi:hypothetical protein